MKDPRWLYAIAVLNVCVAVTALLGVSHLVPLQVGISAPSLATAVGLGMRKDWARRWTIVLWTVYMVIAVPVGLLGGFRQFGVTGAVVALTLAIGVPVLVTVYLSQPEIKQAVGSPAPTESGTRTVAYMLAGFTAGLVLLVWIAMAMMRAIGRGLR